MKVCNLDHLSYFFSFQVVVWHVIIVQVTDQKIVSVVDPSITCLIKSVEVSISSFYNSNLVFQFENLLITNIKTIKCKRDEVSMNFRKLWNILTKL